MEGDTFTDEIDCGSFYDQIDDLIEFPAVTDTSLDSVDCNEFNDFWITNSDELQVSDPVFPDSNCVSALSTELSVPYEDIVQLEWLSTFVEESFSGSGMTINKQSIPVKNEPMSSPISVLESSTSTSNSSSSSSCSGGNNMIQTHRGPQCARSKRPRPPVFNPRAAIDILSPSTLVSVPVLLESENFFVPHNGPKSVSSGPEQKNRKNKPKSNHEDKNENRNQNLAGQGVRKCMHCEITKTPQWRAGPMGPKTLCNACGVRYKSGRLFPEYRPAASPTFVPSLHSNSHKKVVEMRTKCKTNDVMVGLCELEPNLIQKMNLPADYM
ncbi:GATA transcription factor 8-like [Rutidosis leptorrhynchoides]|uniref:GATA transcription factor 8-like n=1 Tax=Rutidosis leptorrhynchoides TaxID=125765 RepID=UPI003A9A0756